MSNDTTPTSPANTSRATDAKLHELLTGEMTWLHGTIDIHRTLDEVLDWVAPVPPANMLVRAVPHYTTNLNDIAAAELALAPELREDYASALDDIVGIEQVVDYRECMVNWGTVYALITTTAHQRALALVAVLERVRGAATTK